MYNVMFSVNYSGVTFCRVFFNFGDCNYKHSTESIEHPLHMRGFFSGELQVWKNWRNKVIQEKSVLFLGE